MKSKSFYKKIASSLKTFYKGKHVLITADIALLHGCVGKITEVFVDTEADDVKFRVQVTPGPFSYDGLEKLKGPKDEVCLSMEDVKLIDAVKSESPSVWLVVEQWDCGSGLEEEISVFLSEESAHAMKAYKIYKESEENGIIHRMKQAAWKNEHEVHEEHIDDNYYICGVVKVPDLSLYYKVKIEQKQLYN